MTQRQNPTVRPVAFDDYRTAIAETWVPAFLEYVFVGLEDWVQRQIEAGNDDVRGILNRDWESVGEEILANDIEKFEHDDDVTIVGLIDDSSFVGGIYVDILDGSTAKINRLWLPEAYRGHGYGKALVEEAIGIVDDHDVAVIHLSTAPFMDTAQAIYDEFGFEYRDDPFPSSTVPPSLTEYWNFMELEL